MWKTDPTIPTAFLGRVSQKKNREDRGKKSKKRKPTISYSCRMKKVKTHTPYSPLWATFQKDKEEILKDSREQR